MKRMGWAAVCVAVAMAGFAQDWVKYGKNPILGDPVKLGTCFDVNVIPGRDSRFDMYFSWRPKG